LQSARAATIPTKSATIQTIRFRNAELLALNRTASS
jgi:hypothetical protein